MAKPRNRVEPQLLHNQVDSDLDRHHRRVDAESRCFWGFIRIGHTGQASKEAGTRPAVKSLRITPLKFGKRR